MRSLTELHESGVVTDAEFERLRTRLGSPAAEELERALRLGLLLGSRVDAARGRNAHISAATWNASGGAHLVESSRIRESSG